jgi:hypothetical protein
MRMSRGVRLIIYKHGGIQGMSSLSKRVARMKSLQVSGIEG